MSDFLGEMADESRRRLRRLHAGGVTFDLEAAPPPRVLPFDHAGFDLIAEVKPSSPSLGRLMAVEPGQVAALAGDYASAGAAAISVVTEETRFGGSLGLLRTVAATVDTPVLRKDFLLDPIQVVEARAAGASGVLLIARLLPPASLAEMTDTALELGMFVLVEIFSEADLVTAAVVFDRPVVLGVNSRDLATLRVQPSRFADLAPLLPGHLPAVAESGILTGDDVAAAARLGYRAALVGTALLTSERPGEQLAALLAAGRNLEVLR